MLDFIDVTLFSNMVEGRLVVAFHVLFPDTPAPCLAFGRIERHIVPVREYNRLRNDLFDPMFYLAENDRVSDLPRADDGLYRHFYFGCLSERHPQPVAGRRLYPHQDMAFNLLKHDSKE
jgi:hypothetical protein